MSCGCFENEYHPVMGLLSELIQELGERLTGTGHSTGNIIRKHTKRLEQLGDLSFPLDPKIWSRLLNRDDDQCGILEWATSKKSLEDNVESLINHQYILPIQRFYLNNNDVHLFLQRSITFKKCFEQIFDLGKEYGFHEKIFHKNIMLSEAFNCNATIADLTQLRASILKQILVDLVDRLKKTNSPEDCVEIRIVVNHKQDACIMCGSVSNETGTKSTISVTELYSSRAVELQLIAQHRYGIKLNSRYNNDYFNKLAKASVLIEMLQNKPHKPIKICLNSTDSRNREPSFIFYNSARISALLKEFNTRVMKNVYNPLPSIEEIDFTLLNQPEEWEILFAYILQFPDVIKNCVCDIEKGVVNPHCLVIFMANLSSIFSIYYRRVKILTIGTNHLLPVLYARIYLLRSVKQIFHNVFDVLGIDPVEEM